MSRRPFTKWDIPRKTLEARAKRKPTSKIRHLESRSLEYKRSPVAGRGGVPKLLAAPERELRNTETVFSTCHLRCTTFEKILSNALNLIFKNKIRDRLFFTEKIIFANTFAGRKCYFHNVELREVKCLFDKRVNNNRAKKIINQLIRW